MELSIAKSWPVALARSHLWIRMSPKGIIRRLPAGISPKGEGTTFSNIPGTLIASNTLPY